MNDTERAEWDETKLNMKTMGDCLNGGTLVARFLATREAARGVYMARPVATHVLTVETTCPY